MLHDWVWFWNMNVNGHSNFFVLWDMDGFVMGHWNWDFLDDSQSLFLMVMVMGLFVMVLWFFIVADLVVTEVLMLIAVAASEVMTTKVMIEQTTLVLLFARFSFSYDWLLFFFSLFFSGNA